MNKLPDIIYYTTITDQDGYILGFDQEDLGEFDWVNDLKVFETTIRSFGVLPYRLGYGHDLVMELLKLKPALLWNMNSGVRGVTREAQVPALCEMLGISLIGSGSWTAFMTQDKTLSANWVSHTGVRINIPVGVTINTSGELGKIDDLTFPGKYIIKTNNEDSSRGLDSHSLQSNKSGVRKQAAQVLENWGAVRVEEFIDGFDISANLTCKPTTGLFPLEPVMIESSIGIYTGSMKNIVPGAPQKIRSPLSEYNKKLSVTCQDLAMQLGKVFRFRHYARVDLRFNPSSNKLYFLECNICPSFEPDDDFVYGASLLGISFSELLRDIISTAYADALNGYQLRDMPAKIRRVIGGKHDKTLD